MVSLLHPPGKIPVWISACENLCVSYRILTSLKHENTRGPGAYIASDSWITYSCSFTSLKGLFEQVHLEGNLINTSSNSQKCYILWAPLHFERSTLPCSLFYGVPRELQQLRPQKLWHSIHRRSSSLKHSHVASFYTWHACACVEDWDVRWGRGGGGVLRRLVAEMYSASPFLSLTGSVFELKMNLKTH